MSNCHFCWYTFVWCVFLKNQGWTNQVHVLLFIYDLVFIHCFKNHPTVKYQLCFILCRFSKLRCICIIYKTILFSLLVKIHLLISKLIYSDSNRQERFLEMSEIICSVENCSQSILQPNWITHGWKICLERKIVA